MKIAAIACVFVLVSLVFQSAGAQANPPNTGANEYNFALASNGATANASGSSGSNVPGNAIDGIASTYWQSSTTTGWIAVRFAPASPYKSKVTLNEVHIHFTSSSKVYSSLSLYLDTNGNGIYESAEKYWSTTSNRVRDVVVSIASRDAQGMKVTIDAKSGSSKPMIYELGAYMRGDSDGDALPNDFETGSYWYQDAALTGISLAVPDDRTGSVAVPISLTQFYGVSPRALTRFSVNDSAKSELTATMGYWNGSAWMDRYVWDPGKRLSGVFITLDPAYQYRGIVPVIALVDHPETVSKVEYRVNGQLKSSITVSSGNEYLWDWDTTLLSDGVQLLNATRYDTSGKRYWHQISVETHNHGPTATWVSPIENAILSGVATVQSEATDPFGVQRVELYVDDVLVASLYNADPQSRYTWNWSTYAWPNGAHTLVATAYDQARFADGWTNSTSVVSHVVTENPLTVHIEDPAPGSTLSGAVTVNATAAAQDGNVSRVEFLLNGVVEWTDVVAPYIWVWNTEGHADGPYDLAPRAFGTAEANVTNTIQIELANRPAEPVPPPQSTDAALPPIAYTLGSLPSPDWTRGESDVGITATVVVDLILPQNMAIPAENASGIIRPAFPGGAFSAWMTWRLVVRDWQAGGVGIVTGFTMRFEVTSDAQNRDTDSDGILDGDEVNRQLLPVTRDSDVDGLSDDYEITPHSLTITTNGVTRIALGLTTSPTTSDSDGDGLPDGLERGIVSGGSTKIIGEVGEVSGVTGSCTTDAWTRVYLRNRYTAPVVIANPPSDREADSGVIRVRAVTDHSFEVCFQEWVVNGGHTGENVSYLVVESGNHLLFDGSALEAGTTSVGTAYAQVALREGFSNQPVVLTGVQSYVDSKAVTSRIRSVTGSGFQVYLRTNPLGTHQAETVGYVAIARQSDAGSLASWTRGVSTAVAGAYTGTISFPGQFAVEPKVLAWFGTENSNADVGIRLTSITNSSATYRRETVGSPGQEVLFYYAFAQSGNITARLTSDPSIADMDGDGLNDGTELYAYGTNPGQTDTDMDGIPDRVEVTDRTIALVVNGTTKYVTVRTSPFSDDSDSDGIKDLDEIDGVFDHMILFYDMSTQTDAAHVRDLSGNGNDGSLRGAVNVTGKIGGALQFDGVNKYVEAADIAEFEGTAPFTVSVWFDRLGSHNYWPEIVSRNTETGQREGWHLFLHAVGYGYDNRIGFERFTEGAYTGVVSSTVTALSTWYQVAVTYDGSTMRMYVNGNLEGSQPSTNAIVGHDYPLRIGGNAESGWSSLNGAIDEVRVWDRALTASEVRGYYNLTSAGENIVSWINMETRLADGRLHDFGGGGHTGLATGTSVVQGRSGLARVFDGADDAILVEGTGASSMFNGGVAISLYASASVPPAADAPLVSRRGSFYLNLTSDGRIAWSVYSKAQVTSPFPISLNRWVRIVVAADGTGLALQLDSIQVAFSAVDASVPTSSASVYVGLGEGFVTRFSGALDELLLLSRVPSSTSTLPDLKVRGIVLDPTNPDTDGDGLKDGEEISVSTTKTATRIPIQAGQYAQTEDLTVSLGGPGWAIERVYLSVGLTHDDIGQLTAWLQGFVGSANSFSYTLRSHENAGESRSFTSYDLLQSPTRGGNWLAPEDFAGPVQTWRVTVFDDATGGKGQIEYVQFQFTVRTLPNRADTDSDGLNDSGEVYLGTDGYQTDPWKADMDGDHLNDSLEVNGWERPTPVTRFADSFDTDPFLPPERWTEWSSRGNIYQDPAAGNLVIGSYYCDYCVDGTGVESNTSFHFSDVSSPDYRPFSTNFSFSLDYRCPEIYWFFPDHCPTSLPPPYGWPTAWVEIRNTWGNSFRGGGIRISMYTTPSGSIRFGFEAYSIYGVWDPLNSWSQYGPFVEADLLPGIEYEASLSYRDGLFTARMANMTSSVAPNAYFYGEAALDFIVIAKMWDYDSMVIDDVRVSADPVGGIVPNPLGYVTDPTRADTDRDGFNDNLDLVPLGDAFLEVNVTDAVVIGTDSHNAGGLPNPFVKATLYGNSTYTEALDSGTGAWSTSFDGEVLQGHRLSVNVPDDDPILWADIEMWSNDTRGYNEHVPIGIAFDTNPEGGCADTNSTTLSLDVASGVLSRRYELRAGCPGSSLFASPLVVYLTVVVPSRIEARIVVPLDYTGVYNVTNESGQVVSWRYTGEPRFVAILLNVTTSRSWDCLSGGGCDDSRVEPKLVLVPRSIFYGSQFYKKLATQDLSGFPADLAFGQNDTSAARNSETLQELITGNATSAEYFAILNFLVRNETGAEAHRLLGLTSDLFLYSLPDDALRLAGYRPLPFAGSVTYVFCVGSCAPTPLSLWELIWQGIVTAVVGFVTTAVVMAVTAFQVLGEILSQIGSWVGPIIAEAAQVVASAVQAAAKVALSFLDFVGDLIAQGLLAVVDSFKWMMSQAVREAIDAIVSLVAQRPTWDQLLLGMPIVFGAAIRGREVFKNLFLALEAAEAAITAIVTVLTVGVGTAVKAAVQAVTKEAIVKAVLSGVLAASALAIGVTVVEAIDESFFEPLFGQVFKGAVGAVSLAWAGWEVYKSWKGPRGPGLDKFASAAAWGFWGLVAELLAGDAIDTLANALNVTDPFVRGAGLLVADVLAFLAEFAGFVEFWAKIPGEPLIEVARKFFLSIVDGVEEAITVVGFVGTMAGIGVHAIRDEYGLSKWFSSNPLTR